MLRTRSFFMRVMACAVVSANKSFHENLDPSVIGETVAAEVLT
ncbi:MAG TPA: hypothetical protein VF467_07225 [Afipia sp.]